VIESIALTNFKAFAHADVRLGSYTLLSGLNSAGKSTILQALALLRQGHDQLRPGGGLPLNGELVELGTGADILHEDWVGGPGDEAEIGFRLCEASATGPYEWRVRYGPDDDYLSLITCKPAQAPSCTLFAPGFQYLRADRANPAVTYPRSHEMTVRRGFLGTRGEYTADFLRHRLDDQVESSALLHPEAPTPRLLAQVEAWMSEICPGVRIQAEVIEQTDLVRLGYSFTRAGQIPTKRRRPTNVGFGLSYVLPVVVACLAARPDSMLLLENPEAHVHPQGQSAMARLTCAAAAAGAQVIVETHSDHILNGVRLAVKGGKLRSEDVVLQYFQRDDDRIDILSPAVGPDGMLTHWPIGFFDEWDRSLDQLLD
jgi:predicted ATPase